MTLEIAVFSVLVSVPASHDGNTSSNPAWTVQIEPRGLYLNAQKELSITLKALAYAQNKVATASNMQTRKTP